MRRFVEFMNTASEALAAELISRDAVFYVPDAPNRYGVLLVISRLSE